LIHSKSRDIMAATDQQFVQMTDEEAIYQESVALMEKRGRRLRRAALTAGIFLGISILCMIYSTIAVRWVLIEWQQPEKTVYQLADNIGMFKVGILADGLDVVADTFVGVLLGLILIGAGVNPATSSLIIVFKVLQQAVMCINVVFLFIACVMVDENLAIYSTIHNYFYSDNLPPIGTQITYIMLLLNKYGDVVAEVFGGVHLLMLGITIILWGVFPRWMGYIIALAGPCMILNSLFFVIWPGYDGDMTLLWHLPMIIAEFWLCGWLLVNVPHPAKNRAFFPATAVEEPADEPEPTGIHKE